MNVTAVVVPPGVVTLTFLADAPAVALIVNVAFNVPLSTTVTLLTVTPDPETVILVPVAVKFAPSNVTGTAVPRTPVFGVTEVSVGAGGRSTVNVTPLLLPLAAVVTFTVLAVSPAPEPTVNVAVTVPSSTTEKLLTVTLLPEMVTPVAVARPDPVNVTGTLVPRAPVFGVIAESTGPSTLNGCELLVPLDVVTVTVRVLIAALAEIVNVAVMVVEFRAATLLTVTPVPDTATVFPVAAKFVPVRVIPTAAPRKPLPGVTDANVGAPTAVYVNPLASVPV